MPNQTPYGNSIKDFEKIEKIGVGGFAKVFKARCLRPGLENKYVAIKQISKVHGKEKRFSQERIEREIKIHSELPPHPAFVKYYTSFEDKNYWYLVLQFCAGGSFESYIKKKSRCSEEEAARLIEEVIHGVQALHHNLVVHRDLTLRNLLLTEKLEVKIADFGLAVKLNHNEEKKNTCLGTPNFMSPEVVNNEPYDFKYDCWSVGCVLYALLYGAPPFNNKKREDIIAGVRHSELVFPPYASSEAKKLLKDMLNKDQRQRIEIGGALKYAFFQKYNKKSSEIQSSHQRSGDSGLSSCSSSGSHRNRSDKRVKKSKDASTSVSRYNSLQNILSESQKQNYFSPLVTSCQSSPSSVHQMKTRFQTLPSRLESQIETPTKKYPECPKYPSELEYLTKRNMSSHIYCSDQQSIFNNTHFERNNDSINRMHGKNSYVVPKSGEENASKESSCSHVEYCPSDSCIHKLSCCCRHQQYSSHHLFENSSKDNRCLQSENTVTENCLTADVTPLNTARLSSRRKEFENKHVVVSILSDGQVCLEFFRKDKKLVHQVYFISQDGFQVTVYKLKKKIPVDPDKPPLTNDASKVEDYTFEDLPKRPIHWKRYQFAKYIVDKVRSITPKVTVHGEHGTCIMMENSPNPNFEMNFYDGFQITESKQEKVIKDKNGLTVTKKDENIHFMLTDFEKMKEQCFKIENIVETYLDSYFPITCKKKPEVYKRSVFHDIGKENIKHSSTLNKQASIVKPREVIITVDNGSHENSHLKNSTFINSNEKNFFSGNERRDCPSLKSIKRTNEWIVAEYEDGIQMHISVQDGTFSFRSIHSESWLHNCPQLQDRYEKDLKDILHQALLLEVKRKT